MSAVRAVDVPGVVEVVRTPRKYMSESELCASLRLSASRISKRRRDGELVPDYWVGETIRWTVENFLAQNRRMKIKEVV